MKEELEKPEDIGKFPWPTKVSIYGDHLTQRIHEARPDLSLVGWTSHNSFFPPGDYETIYSIKKGKGFIGKLFGEPLVYICSRDSPWPATNYNKVTVYEKSLRKPVEQIVDDLNKESGLDFKVEYW